jgi:outer membrane receptor for ferrienterochelin and colicins
VTAGLRLNRNEQFGFRLTPKLSAMYRLGEAWRLRGTWSQGFKTPTPKELYYRYVRQMSGTYLYLGNKDLTPQLSNYYSAGIEYTHHGWSLTLTGYYNRVKDMIALVTIPNYQAPEDLYIQYQPIKTRQYKNLEDAKTYGVDVSARYTMREFTFGLNYSYLDTDANIYDTHHERMKQVVIDGMAHHKANLFATWNHSFSPIYHLGVGIYGKMSTKRYYQLNGNGKGYQIWRLNTTHELAGKKNLKYLIEAGVDNIFNYVDRTDHGLHLGTTTPGTTLYASFTIRFSQGKKINSHFIHQLKQSNDEEN